MFKEVLLLLLTLHILTEALPLEEKLKAVPKADLDMMETAETKMWKLLLLLITALVALNHGQPIEPAQPVVALLRLVPANPGDILVADETKYAGGNWRGSYGLGGGYGPAYGGNYGYGSYGGYRGGNGYRLGWKNG
ncbi:hypothetical protein CBL_04445 [Carabus blaptoides fortunei]